MKNKPFSTIKIEQYTFAVYVIIASALIISLLFISGENFPIPWGDESSFIFQAIAWSESNTLYTPILNKDRVLMWMQPGYMVLIGSIFKIFGFSFEIARQISWLFYLSSFIIFAIALKHITTRLSIIILSMVFILPTSFAIGNVARMDSLIVLIGAIVLICLIKRRFLGAITFVAIGSLIHFNSVYFIIPTIGAIIFAILDKQIFRTFRPMIWELSLLLLAFGLFVIYISFIFSNLEGFISDMTYQFSRKIGREPFYKNPFSLKSAICALQIIVLCFAVFYKKGHLIILSLFSFALFLIYAVGQEMWYQIFLNLSLGFLIIVILNIFSQGNVGWNFLFLICALIFMLFISRSMVFAGMNFKIFNESYVDKTTASKIKGALTQFISENKDTLTVTYMSKGVDLIFYPILKDLKVNLFHKLPTEIQGNLYPDICIYITRASDPKWLSDYDKTPGSDYCRLGLILSEKNGDVRVFKFNQ